jgi:glucose-6-phosphate 1-dehydrogenase
VVERIVIFGATGDLTGRYLIPALARLYEAGRLPSGIKVTGIDRKQWKNGFRRLVLDSLERHAGGVSANARARMAVEVLEYCQADEEGVDPERGTETFAQVTLMIDNLRWAGVPFVLRGGKALGRFRGEIAVYFKPVPHLAFQQADDTRPNVLRLRLKPDQIALSLYVKGPYDPFDLEQIELNADFAPQDLFSAYERLFLDLLEGNNTLFVRADEAEEAWRVAEPVLDAWEEGLVPLLEYSAGSDGPNEASLPPEQAGHESRNTQGM